MLSDHSASLLALDDLPFIARLIARSCGLKASVVAGDEHENSSRALLNLGHSFGHAVEKLQNFCGWSHGEAVAFGMAAAARLATLMEILDPAEETQIKKLLQDYG